VASEQEFKEVAPQNSHGLDIECDGTSAYAEVGLRRTLTVVRAWVVFGPCIRAGLSWVATSRSKASKSNMG
jgi:hypothetical protein